MSRGMFGACQLTSHHTANLYILFTRLSIFMWVPFLVTMLRKNKKNVVTSLWEWAHLLSSNLTGEVPDAPPPPVLPLDPPLETRSKYRSKYDYYLI